MIPTIIPFVTPLVPGYQWYGCEPGHVFKSFEKTEGPLKEGKTMVMPPTNDLGSYAATERAFNDRGPVPPTQLGGCTFPAIRGGVLTPPFVYRVDRTATYSNTVYRRIGRGEDHTYQEEMFRTCVDHGTFPGNACWVCGAIDKNEEIARAAAVEALVGRHVVCAPAPLKKTPVARGARKTKQLGMSRFAVEHRYGIPAYDGTPNEPYVLPKRRKARKAVKKRKRKPVVRRRHQPVSAWGNRIPTDDMVVDLVRAFTPLSLEAAAALRGGMKTGQQVRKVAPRKFKKQTGIGGWFK